MQSPSVIPYSIFEMVASLSFNSLMLIRSLHVASHSSYLVVLLPPPIVLYLAPLLRHYSVHCHIARCRIHVFVL